MNSHCKRSGFNIFLLLFLSLFLCERGHALCSAYMAAEVLGSRFSGGQCGTGNPIQRGNTLMNALVKLPEFESCNRELTDICLRDCYRPTGERKKFCDQQFARSLGFCELAIREKTKGLMCEDAGSYGDGKFEALTGKCQYVGRPKIIHADHCQEKICLGEVRCEGEAKVRTVACPSPNGTSCPFANRCTGVEVMRSEKQPLIMWGELKRGVRPPFKYSEPDTLTCGGTKSSAFSLRSSQLCGNVSICIESAPCWPSHLQEEGFSKMTFLACQNGISETNPRQAFCPQPDLCRRQLGNSWNLAGSERQSAPFLFRPLLDTLSGWWRVSSPKGDSKNH